MLAALWACAYGLRAFNLYMTVDREQWYGAPIDADGEPRPQAERFRRLITALQRTRFHTLAAQGGGRDQPAQGVRAALARDAHARRAEHVAVRSRRHAGQLRVAPGSLRLRAADPDRLGAVDRALRPGAVRSPGAVHVRRKRRRPHGAAAAARGDRALLRVRRSRTLAAAARVRAARRARADRARPRPNAISICCRMRSSRSPARARRLPVHDLAEAEGVARALQARARTRSALPDLPAAAAFDACTRTPRGRASCSCSTRRAKSASASSACRVRWRSKTR